MGMKTLVTGGAGFLGAHLCERLIAQGNKVVCIDNLSTGDMVNIKHLLNNKSFEFIEMDITQPIHVEVDEIYNLASPASPYFYQLDPIKTLMTNVCGMNNVLENACRCGAKVLQASTSEVYGDPVVHPQPEDYRGNVSTIGIRACYDEGKRCAETLCFDYRRKYNVMVKVIRIFNTFGPKMKKDDGRVISNFIVQALQGRNITIYGDGLQTRSFCFVDDLIEGMMRMMNSRDDFSGPVNLGSTYEFTMLELAEKVISLTDSSSRIVFKPLPEDDPLQRQPVLDLAKEELGWEPRVSLEEGLIKTINYFRSIL